jgi:dTDP-D-glucose 4,6-dehydratase
VEFESGLADTIAWYRENEAWWRPLIEALEGSPAVSMPSTVEQGA